MTKNDKQNADIKSVVDRLIWQAGQLESGSHYFSDLKPTAPNYEQICKFLNDQHDALNSTAAMLADMLKKQGLVDADLLLKLPNISFEESKRQQSALDDSIPF